MGLASGELSELSPLERLLLWSMRAWAIGLGARVPVEDKIVQQFARWGAADAAGQMHGFVFVLAHNAVRMIDLDCVCEARISRDEKNLIAVLALVQHRRFPEALALLRPLVGADAALAALDCARRTMAGFTAARWFLPPPNGTDIDPGRAENRVGSERRPVTVH